MNMPTKCRHPLGRATKSAPTRHRSRDNRVEPLEARIAPAAVVSVAGNFNFEEAVDFDHWTVNAGPGSALTEYTSTTTVIRGAFAPEGNAYAHLSFEGRASIGSTGFGPSIQSEIFSAAAGEEISVAWRATNGIDTAHPRGRLFASDGTPVGTFFDTDSGTTAFANAAVTIPADGQYYLQFEAGSSDVSVGGLVGATLDIDAIHRTPDGITVTTLPNGQSSVDIFGSTLNGNTFLITLDDTGEFAEIFVNGNLNFIQPLSSIDRINITGGDANDQLTVDSSRGLIVLAEGIHFNGGASSDILSLIQTGGLSNVSDTFSVGPGLGDGISEISDGTNSQTVYFQNVEPVLDSVASASLTVNATAADNTINSTDGPGGGSFTGATALIAIDGFATFEFNNKASLTINALEGSDTINLNNSGAPAGLTVALIQGGDPTLPVGDTLYFANAGSIHPVAIGTGTITTSGFPTVNFTGIEATAVAGYTLAPSIGGLLVTATGDQNFPGEEDAFVITTSSTDQFLTMELNGSIGLYANQSAIAQIDVFGLAGDDSLTLIGTAAVDAFTLNPTAADAGNGGIAGRVAIGYTGIELVVLNGLGEDDTFALGGEFGRLEVNGGSGTDSVDLTGTATPDAFTLSPTAVDAGSMGITGGVAVDYTGIESVSLNGLGGDDTFAIGGAFGTVSVNGGGGADTVDLTGTAAPDAFTFNPTAADAGNVGITGGAAVDYTEIESVVLNGLGGDDTFTLDGTFGLVSVNGGSGADTVDLTGTATADIFTNSPTAADAGNVGIAGGAAVGYTGTELVVLNGLGEADAFILGGAFGAVRVNGAGGDDTVDLTGTPAADAFIFSPTAADAGYVGITGGAAVDYTGIEAMLLNGLGDDDTFTLDGAFGIVGVNGGSGADSVDLTGTAAADVFTLNPVSADTGTAGIAGGAAVVYTLIESVVLNGLGGDDSFVLGGTFGTVSVNGGSGADTVDLTGTAGPDTFTFSPTAADAGNVGIAGGAAVAYTGIESVVLNALGGDDTFAIGGAVGRVALNGGSGDDTVDFSAAASGVVFDLDAVFADQVVNGTGQIVSLGDVIENFSGSSYNDTLHANAANFTRNLYGGDNSNEAFPPGDELFFDGQGQVVLTTLADWNTGIYRTTGFADVAFDEFETPIIGNSPSGPGFGTPESHDVFNTGDVYKLLQLTPNGNLTAGIRPIALATGDLNSDGFADMVTVNPETGRLNVLLNLGNGKFGTPVSYGTRGLSPRDLVIGNFDANRGLDIAVTNRGSNTVAILSGNNIGGFSRPTLIRTASNPSAITVGHVDGDRTDDIIITHPTNNKISVLLGTGAGFGPAKLFKTAATRPTDVIIGDFNGDGRSDVVTANKGANNVSLFQGDGLGGLAAPTQFATGSRPGALAFADFDLDGVLDLAVSNRVSSFVSILLSNGAVAAATQFQSQLQVPLPEGSAPVAIVAADFNGDGHADLGLGSKVGTNFTVLLGGNFATFSLPYEFGVGTSRGVPKVGLAAVDLNNDGLLDVITTGRNRLEVRVFLRKFEIMP